MKKSRKLLSLLLALVMVLTSFPVALTAVGGTVATAAENTENVGLCTPGTAGNRSYSGSQVSLSNALYKFDKSGDGYTVSNNRTSAGKVFLNLKNDNWGLPNQTDSDVIYVEKSDNSSSGEQVTLYGTVDALVFGRNYSASDSATGQLAFDRIDKLYRSSTDTHGYTGGTIVFNTAFWIYKPVEGNEQSSQELKGFVRLSNPVSQIEDGKEYLIVSLHKNGDYFVLYPSANTANTDNSYYAPTHAAKVADVVTGVVDYSGVIYTQGADNAYTSFGTNIADGTGLNGDYYKTTYSVKSGWSIDSVYVVDGANLQGTGITANGGKLTGTISLKNGNDNVDLYELVLLETHLKHNGNDYVQYDYIYVTTTPAPAQTMTSVQRWAWAQGYTEQANVGIIMKGSTSDYKAGSFNSGDKNYNFRANSLGPFTANSMSFDKNDHESTKGTKCATTNADKLGGWIAFNSAGSWSDSSDTRNFTGPVARYYYDFSSSNNPGFVESNGASAKIEWVFNRPYCNPNGNKHTVADGVMLFYDINFTFNGNKKVYANNYKVQNDGSTTGTLDYGFKAFNYGVDSANAIQYFTESLENIPQTSGTVNASIYADINHSYSNKESNKAINHTTQPIKIYVDTAKIDLRDLFNKYTAKELSADDYTPASWNTFKNAMLDAQKYLNNYSVTQTVGESRKTQEDNLRNAYNGLEKIADFTPINNALEANADNYASFPLNPDGTQKYSFNSWNDGFKAAYDEANTMANVTYGTHQKRLESVGFTGGPDNMSNTQLQNEIQQKADNITAQLKAPADDQAFVSAKNLAGDLDLEAYSSTAATNIKQAITDGDGEIYIDHNGKQYIKLSKDTTDQSVVDAQVTAVLEAMNVAGETADAGASAKGKTTSVTINKNSVNTASNTYAYGASLAIDVLSYVTADEAKSLVATVEYTYADGGKVKTIVPVKDNQIKFVAKCQSIEVNLDYNTAATIIVRDYFDTIIYTGSGTMADIAPDDSAQSVTISGTVVSAKPSPAFSFQKWNITEADGVITVAQQGTRIGGVHLITADGAKVYAHDNDGNIAGEQTSFKGYNNLYTVKADSAPAAWKMEVNGKSYLAGYNTESITRFTSDNDVKYSTLTEAEAKAQFADSYGKPVSYGDAYLSGENRDKFTLSCFYSAPAGVTVTETGVLYSTDASLTPSTMTTTASGVVKRMPSAVSDFGTYTMTKKDATAGGTHLMRSFVSYTTQENNVTVIRVVYGPVYKCEGSTISIVND